MWAMCPPATRRRRRPQHRSKGRLHMTQSRQATIGDELELRHKKSADLYKEALDVFPSGVTHDIRFMRPFPIFVTHAKGSRKWDVDGNEYVDYFGGHGALILGHCHPQVTAAVTE